MTPTIPEHPSQVELEHPDPVESLRLYIDGGHRCPYLWEIYRRIEAKWDATQTA